MRSRPMLPLLAALIITGCGDWEPTSPPNVRYATFETTRIRFAAIGDFGLAGPAEADVAKLVQSWNPDFIVTVGDNNYHNGSASTIDRNIGQYYHSFIHPYTGSYGAGATRNRFWPTLGNHEYRAEGAAPHLAYFTLPGNERYYDYREGPVQFFALNSNVEEPDGIDSTSIQAQWLKNQLAVSTAPWKVVFFHHAPYSSSHHGNFEPMQWPFKQWGANVVLAGHDHTYERLIVDDLPYFVNGLGGRSIYNFYDVEPGSEVRYNADYGAQLVEATADSMTLEFYARTGELIDSYMLINEEDPGSGEDTTSIVLSFQNGSLPDPTYTGTEDTHLSEHKKTRNYGNAATVLIDGSDPKGKDKRALIKWDLSAIPRTAVVSGASITFHVEDASWHRYQIYRVKRDWKETEATWNRYAGRAAWHKDGAESLTDRATTVLGTITAAVPGFQTITLNSEGVALVQGWVDGSIGNMGVILMNAASDDGVDVSSSEAAVVAHRPNLTVTYR